MQMAMNMMQQPGMQDMVSNMMRNMGGAGGLFANTGMDPSQMEEQQRTVFNQILDDPEVKNNERLTRIFTEIRDNGPQTIANYMSDPEVSAFMQKYASKMLGTNNPLSNMYTIIRQLCNINKLFHGGSLHSKKCLPNTS